MPPFFLYDINIMFEALFAALATIVSGPSLFFLILGVLIGLVVGVIPGSVSYTHLTLPTNREV